MSFRATLVVAAALTLFVGRAVPAGDAAPVRDSAPISAPTASIPAAPFDAERATAAYMATLSPAAQARSDAYFEGGYWLSLWDALIGIGVAWVLLRTRIAARMRDRAMRVARRPWVHTAIFAAGYIVLTSVLTLPWAAYEGYFREHQYGMSNQTLAAWLGDEGKGLAIGLVFGCATAVAVYAVIRRARRSWWLWGALVAMLLLVFQSAIGPTYLEPVFNKFYPLPDSALKERILSLARANGIPAQQVYEYDASRQTTKVSAHVSGMFGTARISLNDNLMNHASNEEIEAVLGHEMGHYVLNHMYKFLPAIFIVVVTGFALLQWGYARVNLRFGRRWELGDVTDVAGMPLLVAIFSVYLFLLTPVVNTLTRSSEAEADAFGLNAARQPDGAAQAALQLSDYRKMRPGPIEEFVFFDHPSGWNRIHRAMIWKAENAAAPDIAAYDAAHHPPGT